MPLSDQGNLSDRYNLIPRTLIFLTSQDSVLLIKGAPSKRLWANCYNAIGGHVERGEDMFSAAWRELREESGAKPDSLWLAGVVTIDVEPDSGICLFVLRGECTLKTIRTSAEGAAEWIQLESVSDLPVVEDLPVLLKKVLAVKPGDPLFSAHYHYDEDGSLKIRFFPK